MRVFIFVVGLLLVAGCVQLTDVDGNRIEIKNKEVGLVGERTISSSAPRQIMKAQVKGSIYETGEMMSVFGTCLDGSDAPLPQGTYAFFNAWYPNGTIFIQNSTMSEMQAGYYLYNGAMDAVQGTYLTEMICYVNGSSDTARAWGEWQNPFWVKRIALLNDTLSAMNLSVDINMSELQAQLQSVYVNLSTQLSGTEYVMNQSFMTTWSMLNQSLQAQNATMAQLQYISEYLVNMTVLLNSISGQIGNVSIQIGELSFNMTNQFQQTWVNQNATNVLINQSYQNLTQQIILVGQIANASVDRNDSYLAWLILQLNSSVAFPFGCNITYSEDADVPAFMKMWEITVSPNDVRGKDAKYPDVICSIATTLTPISTAMTPDSSGKHFTASEFINYRGDFNWIVDCCWQ